MASLAPALGSLALKIANNPAVQRVIVNNVQRELVAKIAVGSLGWFSGYLQLATLGFSVWQLVKLVRWLRDLFKVDAPLTDDFPSSEDAQAIDRQVKRMLSSLHRGRPKWLPRIPRKGLRFGGRRMARR